MPDHVYKTIELVGSSSDSMEGAVENAVARAAETLRNLRWFEVLETRGYIDDQRVSYWQVRVRIGFTLDEEQSAA
ncbi:MAG: dodecin [Candidatus Bipolaricaulia bacterium]